MLLWIVQLLAQPPLAAVPSRRRVLGATLVLCASTNASRETVAVSTHEFVPLAQYSLRCRFARVVVLKLVCLTYALVVARFPSPSELAEEVQCSRQTLGPAPEPTTRGPGDLGMPASCDQWQERGIEEWLCAWGGVAWCEAWGRCEA